jgi:hypothetical protein
LDDGTDSSAVDAALANWRQGDLLLSATVPAIRLASAARPLSAAAEAEFEADPSANLLVVPEQFPGLMIVSQTCDLVRASKDRPYAQICPLVAADEDLLETTKKGERPRFLHVSGLNGEALVADLEQVFTVEKTVLAELAASHRPGAEGDAEVRRVGRAIANKFGRPALPEAFVGAVSRMRKEIVKKHDKASPLGAFLKAALEIRVMAKPDWIATEEVEFLFVFERDGQIPADHDTHVDTLIGRFEKSDAYPRVEGRAVGLDRLTAATYRESDVLDLDNLSRTRGLDQGGGGREA